MNIHNHHGRVLVVGSANMDMVLRCEQFPQPGETIFATSFETHAGGKGANQAVACAKLGAGVTFLGKMGADIFRDDLLHSLEAGGVDTAVLTSMAPTGVALIAVDESGENEIIVASGSNMRLLPEEIDTHEHLFSSAAIVLLQLEIPTDAVVRAAELGRKHGATVILNPAPARPLPPELYQNVDILVPNQIEAAQLAGMPADGVPTASVSARHLRSWGVNIVIVTLGAEGALLISNTGERRFPALEVDAVDTTGAGDAFCGALACGLAMGRDLADAVELAIGAAAFSVTQFGAQSGMPVMEELDRFLSEHDAGVQLSSQPRLK